MNIKQQTIKKIFGNQEVKQLENSFYQVGNKHAVISMTDPKSEGKLFGISQRYMEKSDDVIFIAGKETAFIIPVDFLDKLPLYTDDKQGRYLITIKYDGELDEFYLNTRKGNVYIQEYYQNLTPIEKIMALAIGTRELIGFTRK